MCHESTHMAVTWRAFSYLLFYAHLECIGFFSYTCFDGDGMNAEAPLGLSSVELHPLNMLVASLFLD